MAILQECCFCHKKQSLKNKFCTCGSDLDKLKRSKKIRFWINFRFPGGKQRRELVGYSIEEARDAEGKRRVQKRENKFFDLTPDSKMTFQELTDWYIRLPKVKALADFSSMKIRLNNFNKIFGDKIINTIKPVDLENYQITRMNHGIRNTTIDQELSNIKGMINKSFDNDMVSGRTLKAFRTVKKVSTKAERTRQRTLSIVEYLKLVDEAPPHLKGMLIVLFNTGMRPREVKGLKWSFIDRKSSFIRLPAEFTKEKAPKNIPINKNVKAVLDSVPRAIYHDLVFTLKGKPVKLFGGPSPAFKSACKRAGIPYGMKVENGIVMHDFRRTFKTNMLKTGIDKVYRDKIVGHALSGMDSHYLMPNEDDLHQAMSKFTNWLDLEIANVDYSVEPKTKSS